MAEALTESVASQDPQDIAIAEIMALSEPKPAAQAEPEKTDTELAADELAPVEAAEEGDIEAEPVAAEEAETDQAEDEPVATVEAPQWYDAEAKAAFAKLPADMQEIVKTQEDKREAVVQRVKTEAKAAAMAEVKPEIERLRTLSAKLTEAIPDEIAAFNERHNYDPQDMQRYRAEDPAGYLALQAQIHAERQALEQKIAVKAEADRVAQTAFVEEQTARLAEIAPDLVKNPENLRALGDYAVRAGIKSEDLQFAEADHLVILDKARRWDDSQKKAAAVAAKPRLQTPPVRTVRPVAAQESGTHKQRQSSEALSAVKPGDIDSAVAAYLARS